MADENEKGPETAGSGEGAGKQAPPPQEAPQTGDAKPAGE